MLDKNKGLRILKNNNHGFTLLEVIVVIAILGVLAALAFPRFSGVLTNSQIKTDQGNARIVESAVELYQAETGGYPNTESFDALITELNKKGYLKNTEIKPESKGTFTYEKTDGTVLFASPK